MRWEGVLKRDGHCLRVVCSLSTLPSPLYFQPSHTNEIAISYGRPSASTASGPPTGKKSSPSTDLKSVVMEPVENPINEPAHEEEIPSWRKRRFYNGASG